MEVLFLFSIMSIIYGLVFNDHELVKIGLNALVCMIGIIVVYGLWGYFSG